MMPKLLLTTRSYQSLGESIVEKSQRSSRPLAMIDAESNDFPDGERYHCIKTPIEDRDVVLLGGTGTDSDTLEVYDLAWALASAGARRLTLIVPYFGYSTMERAVYQGEVVRAKVRAHLLSSIPSASQGNRIVLLDLHSEGLPFYFDGHIRPVHLYAKPLIMAEARRLGNEDFVFACTDAGRAKWVESLANDMGVQAAFVFKRRLDGQRTEVAGISAQVSGKYVVLYDDMIRTGSSLIQAAKAYRAGGAIGIAAIATHGVLPANSLERLRDSQVLDCVVCTDSHPRANQVANSPENADGFLRVISIADLLVDFLSRG